MISHPEKFCPSRTINKLCSNILVSDGHLVLECVESKWFAVIAEMARLGYHKYDYEVCTKSPSPEPLAGRATAAGVSLRSRPFSLFDAVSRLPPFVVDGCEPLKAPSTSTSSSTETQNMLIGQNRLDSIRNTMVTSPASVSFIERNFLRCAVFAELLKEAVRKEFANDKLHMDLSDEEEKTVQSLEKTLSTLPISGRVIDDSTLSALHRLIRTRHIRRVVVKSPGQLAHEAFHTHLSSVGESKYGQGCWAQLDESRKKAWEAAAEKLQTKS